MTDNSCVKVAVRIRPQIPLDKFDKICTTVVSNEPQIFIGKDKAFTFDEVFDVHTIQEEIYDECVRDLVEGCFEGYNATVLAYGQTGSGKTYTMGTGFDVMQNPYQRGIVPRAIEHLFQEVERRKTVSVENGGCIPDIKINAQFIELYNEEIIDLLDPVDSGGHKKTIKIHEDSAGGIYCVNLFVRCVTTVDEALECLKTGSLSRTTASTQMNAQSSRSHAIFTIHIWQQRVAQLPSFARDSCNSNKHEHTGNLNEFETLTAKFHFVDLAGSERLKRTQATGDRQKEGISINSGLLALGNVISALGDKSRRVTHVPYRDSKLTRLLQDSLGGNSRTLMIACISPSDRDFMETLNTLTYANRAKKIKNKVTVNMDKTSQTISSLRQEVENLRLELIEYKQGKRIVGEDGVESINDMYHENAMLQTENNSLKTRVKALQETVEHLTVKNSALLVEKEAGKWINTDEDASDITQVIKDYIKEIEMLRARVLEAEEVNSCLRSRYANKSSTRLSGSPTSTVAVTGQYDIRTDSPASVQELLEQAKEDVRKLKKKKKKLKAGNTEKENGERSGSDEDKDVDEKNEEEEEMIIPEDSSSESEDQEVDYTANLADLTCEISMKEKLIRQVEMQQRRMLHMQQRYEEKIVQLQNTIQITEQERDKILQNLGKSTESQHSEKARRVNEDFERKLSALKKDMQSMQVAKKQHVHMMKNESRIATELKKLKNDLAEMKKAKVALLNKMKEEAKKHKESEFKRNREISQLKKDQRNKETRIKTLEVQKDRKDAVLRRKQEELIALRRRNKNNRPGVRTNLHATTPARNFVFSPKLAKQKWQNLEKKITKLVLNKQSIAVIEKDMNFYLVEREKLSRCLDSVERKLHRAKREMKDVEVIRNLEDERANVVLSLDYNNEQISECQISITQIDDTKNDLDAMDLSTLYKNMNIEELKYLIEKLLTMSINQSFQAVQQESIVKDLEVQLKQVIDDNAVQEQLLMHIINQAHEGIAGFIEARDSYDGEEMNNNENFHSAVDSSVGHRKQDTFVVDNPRKKKAREMAATAEDILFSGGHEPVKEGENQISLEGYDVLGNFPIKLSEAIIDGKISEKDQSSLSCFSGSTTPPNYGDGGSLTRSVTPVLDVPIGEMIPFTETSHSPSTTYLRCTHVAEGHKDGVTCIACTDDVLFSGSRDRTVKIWDLSTGREIYQLVGHPNIVNKVKYCEYSRLAYTVSMASVKVWDMRKKSPYVQTLSSSGVTSSGVFPGDAGIKHVIPPGEHQINDIALSLYGTTLFSAATGSIRMWDMNMFRSVASLNCGFQSIVSCLTVTDFGMDEYRVISGSHENSIKIFEVLEGNPGIHLPKCALTPPHYDAIQALIINGDYLFSASSDSCVKKWDLCTKSLEKSSSSECNDYLCALDVIPSGNLFLTGSRTGYLSLWSADSFALLEELRAHKPAINAITSNRSSIFTASDDSTIGIWKLDAMGISFDEEC